MAPQGSPVGHKAPQGSSAHATSLAHLLSVSTLTPDSAPLSEKEDDIVSVLTQDSKTLASLW